MVELTVDGHIDPNDIVIVETQFIHFKVDLGEQTIQPKFQITWPRNSERVVMPSDRNIEVSFRVTQGKVKGVDKTFDGNVCLTWGTVEELSGASFVCGEGQSSVLVVPNVKNGRNVVTGVLVDKGGQIISDEHATSSNAFFVEELGGVWGVEELELEAIFTASSSSLGVYNRPNCGDPNETIDIVVISAR